MIGERGNEDAMPQTIFIADDEKNIRSLIAAFLTQDGFAVEEFENGGALIAACEEHLPDLVVFDVMMPGVDGLSACSALRRAYPGLPIIIVSAKDSPYDRVTGLTLGCDDYMVKPFLPLELVTRVHALLRRAGNTGNNEHDGHRAEQKSADEISFNELRMHIERRSAHLNGTPLSLTPAEFDFLAYLIKNQERAVSREELLHELWQIDWKSDTRATDDLVKRLRRKLRDADAAVCIETVWGFGFRITTME